LLKLFTRLGIGSKKPHRASRKGGHD
jgi:hypothetical protein